MPKSKKRRNKVVEFLKLLRIEHSIMLLIAVVAAEVIVLGHPPSAVVFVESIIPPILISAGSFAINDYYDVEADRKNGFVERPLVNGSISTRTAFASAMILFVVGAISALALNQYAFYISAVFAILAFLYSFKLKELFAVGNAYIALSMVIPFIYGNYVVSSQFSFNIGLISIIIFLAGFAREIHGMIRDYSGDLKARKVRNLVYYLGISGSSVLAGMMYIAAVVISIFLFFLSGPFNHNLIYIAPILLTDIVLAYIAFGYTAMLYKTNKGFFRRARNWSLAAMALAIIVFLLSALIYVRI
jgi:geranylgeranylglycerol-phosphate geranylgeranyltransferase